MKEVHLTVRKGAHYWDIQHPPASDVIGKIVILQLPGMDPIRMAVVLGNLDTENCQQCPVYARNISGLPSDIDLICKGCRRLFDGGYHYENIDKVLEDL